jgi:acyl-CoA synthetase (AMP-forming)/AMP-acid ligase II
VHGTGAAGGPAIRVQSGAILCEPNMSWFQAPTPLVPELIAKNGRWPRNPNGKVLKRELRQEYSSLNGNPAEAS